MRSRIKRFAVVCALVMSGSALAPRAATACIHGKVFRQQVNPTLRDVRRAEQLLAKNRHDRAAKMARRAFAEVDQLPPGDDVADLFDRAQRTAALATVRSDGDVSMAGGIPKTEAGRATSLQWAALLLQYQAARHPDNLVVQAEYAEALTKVPHMDGVAHEILASLAADDLMPTARAYALLAHLQTERGDVAGSEMSRARCEEFAGSADACKVA
jgi:hypothetical protein